MSSAHAVLWLIGSVAALGLALQGWEFLRRAAERRARQLRYKRLGRESGPQRPLPVSQPVPLHGAMHPRRAAEIRQDAEAAARLAATSSQGQQPRSPYPEGSPEYVLWIATYHLTMTELADESAASDGVEWKAGGPAGRGPGPT